MLPGAVIRSVECIAIEAHKEKMDNKHKFYKDHFLLITRLFDNRLKAFIKHILMANENIEHYSYRIGKLKLYHFTAIIWTNSPDVNDYNK